MALPTPASDLVIDPRLLAAWESSAAGEVPVTGLAAAVSGDRAAVVAVAPGSLDDRVLESAAAALAEALGVRRAEVIAVPGSNLAELVREWTYQAAAGSGRGVHVRVLTDEESGSATPARQPSGLTPDPADPGAQDLVPPAPAGVRVLVSAIDSSARELALRLASPQEPALNALRAVLGGRSVTVQEVDPAVWASTAAPAPAAAPASPE